MKAILSGERRTLVCLIFWLAGSFTAGPSSDVSGERDLAARVALVAPNPVWPRSSALDARLEKEIGLDEADQLGDERRLRSMSFFEAIAGNDEDTFCKMLNEGMGPNVELPTPVPIAFQKRFTDGRLRYYLSKDEGFTASSCLQRCSAITGSSRSSSARARTLGKRQRSIRLLRSGSQRNTRT